MPRWTLWLIVFGVAAALVAGTGVLISDGDDAAAPAPERKASPSPSPERPVRFARFHKTPNSFDPYPDRKQIKRCFTKGAEGVEQPSFDRMTELQDGEPMSGPTLELGFVASVVETARDLRFERTPRFTFLEKRELGKRYADFLDRHYSEEDFLDREDILLSLGAINLIDDLRTASATYTGRDILGFYMKNQKRVYAPFQGSGSELTDAQKQVLGHEMLHALVAQRFPDPFKGYGALSKEDEGIAIQALLEGDAVLTDRLVGLTALGLDASYPLRGEPKKRRNFYLSRQSVFPYADGLGFVCTVFLKGGWEAVNKAYRHPPTTSAEIIWPNLFLDGFKPKDPRDISVPGDGWRLTARRSFGASSLFSLFEAPFDLSRRAIAKLGRIGTVVKQWNGGELALYRDEADVSSLGIAMETQKPRAAMCEALCLWYQRAFKAKRARGADPERYTLEADDSSAVLWCKGKEVRMGIGPDIETARALTG